MNIETQNLDEVFAVITPDLAIQSAAVSPSLYENLDRNYSGFKGHMLVSRHDFNQDWSSWERHPAGDEFVMLISGAAEFVLKTDLGEERVSLDNPGSWLRVPKNIWHTARVTEPVSMLFITPGEATENAADP